MKTNTAYRIITFVLILLNIVSCTKLGVLDGSLLRIKNTTDSEVELRLFNNQEENDAVTIVNGGPGEILFEARQIDGQRFLPSPSEIFEKDSIVVIFDNERFETHIVSNLEEDKNSILFFIYDFYEIDEEKNELTYEIDQENYDNAEPCVDGC